MGRVAAWVVVAAFAVGTAAAAASTRAAADGAGVPVTPDAIADAVLSSLNESVDPCQDAYEWACGGWRAANPPPPSVATTSTFSSVRARVTAAVDRLLRAPAMATSRSGVFYAACMNTSRPAVDVAPLARLRPALTALTGANASVATAVGALATLAAAAVDKPVFDMYVTDSPWRPGARAVFAAVPDFTTAEAAFRGATAYDVSVRAAHKKMLVTLAGFALDAGLLGETPAGATAASAVADAAAAFEAQLIAFAGKSPPTAAAVRADVALWAHAVDDQLVASQALVRNATSPIALVLELVASAMEGVGVTPPANADVVALVEYVRAVEAWLRAAVAPGGNGLKPLQSYLAVAATREYALLDLLGSAPRAAVEAYTAVVYGLTAPKPRLVRCVSRAGTLFPTEVGTAFADAQRPAMNKTFAVAMAEDVRAAVGRLFDRADWLDAPTTAAARKKLAAMQLLMGEVTPAAGAEDLSGVVVSADDFPASYLSASARLWREQWARAAAPADRYMPLMPVTVNAFYSPTSNVAMMTAAFLQYPFFYLAAPHAVTFAGAAAVVGHEIGHGFDASGRRLDAQAQLRNWSSAASAAAWVENDRCLRDAYATMAAPAYVPAGAALNATRTARESQADHMGLAAAWAAFSARAAAAGGAGPANARLDARFTPAQLFFTAFAQVECTVARAEAQRHALAERVHPPGWARVRGPLSQFAPFAAAFNCSAGTPYNPPDRCTLW